jgi:signal transduction histidine kinase
MKAHIASRRSVLSILVFGFSLVILFLVAAGATAVRNTRLIRSAAAELSREQSLMTRLIDEIQREQAFVDALLNHLRGVRGSTRRELRARLNDVRTRFDVLLQEAESSGGHDRWAGPAKSARAFFDEARRLLQRPDLENSDIETLWSRHEDLLSQVVELVDGSSAQITEVERQLRGQSEAAIRESFVLLGSCLAAALACAVLTIWLVSGALTRIAEQERELARVSFHLLENQESSAQRLSHELHDEMGQCLSAMKANLAALNESNLEERRRDCMQLTDQALVNVRELSQLLRPVILDDFGLGPAVGWLASRFSQRTGIAVRYESDFQGRLPVESETHLFRIAQEALTNIARHSGATEVSIGLRMTDHGVLLTIADNGKGFSAPDQRTRGLGLTGMLARARRLGGELRFDSEAGHGVRIEVRVPAAAGAA